MFQMKKNKEDAVEKTEKELQKTLKCHEDKYTVPLPDTAPPTGREKESDMQGVCYQAVHGKYAMASGGLLGVGVGNSGEKWGYLPEAHNDFIFAIIGEETGFVGASLVILLFLVLGWCMLVVALQSQDRYITLVLASITVWIVGQAFVNIGVVVGLFPVMGVPLPFVSAGGSSLILCLGAAGVTISMMKQQPQIQAEMQRV